MSNAKKHKLRIFWSKNKQTLEGEWQIKNFETTEKAVEWCRIHSKNILRINNSGYLLDDQISHWTIMDAMVNEGRKE